MSRSVYRFGGGVSDGEAGNRNLLGGKGANLLRRPVDEVLHRQPICGFPAAEQIAHVVADAGNADQSRFFVEQRLDLFR